MNIQSHCKTSGFTLIEMMIVISIIMILMGISLFPYQYYMQRGYVERATDGLSQEWILSHKAIRGGLEFDPLVGNHASLLLIFEKGSSKVSSYLLSGSTVPDIEHLPTDPLSILPYKTFAMENDIKVLEFTGSLSNRENRVGYLIIPPYASGAFLAGGSVLSLTGARIIVGYPGAKLGTGRARDILLRTYLK